MTYRNDLAALEARRALLRRELDELRTAARERAAREAECAAELASIEETLAGPRRPLPLLDRVAVASPCDVAWAAMRGDERVRYCGGCAKDVYNLSAMTRDEAEALLRERGADLCARFYRRADGTLLTSDCPAGASGRRMRALTYGAIASAAIAGTAFAAAPEPRPMAAISVAALLGDSARLKGRRVRVEGTVVPGSLSFREGPCEYRFRLAGGGVEMPVRHAACVVPDTFREIPGFAMPAMLEGELQVDASFEASFVTGRYSQGYTMDRSPPAASGPPSGE